MTNPSEPRSENKPQWVTEEGLEILYRKGSPLDRLDLLEALRSGQIAVLPGAETVRRPDGVPE